jgi:hypothetical protein
VGNLLEFATCQTLGMDAADDRVFLFVDDGLRVLAPRAVTFALEAITVADPAGDAAILLDQLTNS